MGDEYGLQEYTVEIGGVEHTLLLSEEDAEARGLTKSKGPVADKARTVPNKSK